MTLVGLARVVSQNIWRNSTSLSISRPTSGQRNPAKSPHRRAGERTATTSPKPGVCGEITTTRSATPTSSASSSMADTVACTSRRFSPPIAGMSSGGWGQTQPCMTGTS